MNPPQLHTAAFYTATALTLVGVAVSLTGASIPASTQQDIANVIGWLLGSTGLVSAVYHFANPVHQQPPTPPGMSK